MVKIETPLRLNMYAVDTSKFWKLTSKSLRNVMGPLLVTKNSRSTTDKVSQNFIKFQEKAVKPELFH